MNFTLTNYNLSELTSKSKLIQQLNNVLTKTYFKVGSNEFVFMLRGLNGAFKLTLPIDCSDEPVYFSTDYSKWIITLQKFISADKIDFKLTKNFLMVSNDTTNTINLGISTYSKDSSEATILDSFIPSKKTEIVTLNKQLTLTPSLVNNFQLADSLFVAQSKTNAIGISNKNIMYSDRSVVLKISHQESLPAELFADLPEDEEYIYLHNFVLRLFSQLSKSNTSIFFSKDYDLIYWEDDNSELVFLSEEREVALPTDEQFKSIQPENKDSSFTVSLETLKEGLDLFTGFYEGSVWKPISFDVVANKETVLRYKHPTTEISRVLKDCTSPTDGKFTVDSENLSKVVNKLRDLYTAETLLNVTFDDEAPGIYCNVEDVYEFVLSKLDDEE